MAAGHLRNIKDLQKLQKGDDPASAGVALAPVSSESVSELASKMSKLRALSDADKQLITTLQERIDQQKKELENRTVTIGTIQRNFENLSAIAVQERKELEALRAAEVRVREEREASAADQKRLAAELEELRKVTAQQANASQVSLPTPPAAAACVREHTA